MILLRTALKNILGSGIRTWINVTLLSIVLVIMVGYHALLDGWFDKAHIASVEWEFADGQMWSKRYDPYDMLTLADAHDTIPQSFARMINQEQMTPVLVIPASIFPQGRMVNTELKGIPSGQRMVKVQVPEQNNETDIPVIVGKEMAKSMSLKKGDVVMARWRDLNGTFDARSLRIADVVDMDNPNVDNGQIWMDLDLLQRLTLMPGQASYLICGNGFHQIEAASEPAWEFKELDVLMRDIYLMEDASKVESTITFIILLSLALLAVFDTQALSIFKRRKEIGTYVALGMSPRKVMTMFTIEGMLYSILGVLVAAVWGTPLLWLFKMNGIEFPQDMYVEAMLYDVMYPAYHVSSIVSTVLIVVVMSGVISYFPARKIAKMNMVLALKGKTE